MAETHQKEFRFPGGEGVTGDTALGHIIVRQIKHQTHYAYPFQ